MATSTRVTRSKGESDGLSLPMRSRPTRREATLGRNGGTALSTSGREHQQQMPTQMPHLTQLPEAAPEKRTVTPPMLPPGLHRPLTPCMPLPASPTSSLRSSAPLFQEDGYSLTSEEEFLPACVAHCKFYTLTNHLLLLWHKYLESLGKNNVFSHVFFSLL